MEYCPIEAFEDGKPYYRNEPHLFKTYDVVNKKNLTKLHNSHKINKNRLIEKYESPLTKLTENSFIEGKWRDNPKLNNVYNEQITYPYPYARKRKFPDQNFIKKLKQVMIDKQKYAIPYNKLDVCRLCMKTLGNKEFVLQKNDITFRFYDSILHYHMRHNVHPSKEFYHFIMNY